MTSLKQRILDAVVPAVCRWIVARMRCLEEMNLSASARWELLRQALEGIARGR